MEHAILLTDGSMVVDASWQCEADVIGSHHGFGTGRVYGELVRRPTNDSPWEKVH